MRIRLIPQILSKYSHGLSMTLAVVMIYFSYSNTFYSPPVLDDFHSYIDEPIVNSGQWSLDQLLLLSQTKFGWGRWIPMITFFWDMTVGGAKIASFHLTNILIHVLCFLAVSYLWLVLAQHATRQEASRQATLAPFAIAFWAAGLWALHPVQTNAVTYLVQRMASLSTLFSVLCTAFYISARVHTIQKGAIDPKATLFYIASVLSFFLAIFSKQNAFIVPLLLFFTEAWFFRTDLLSRSYRFAARHWILTAVAIAAVILGYAMLFPGVMARYEHRNFTLPQRVLTEFRVILWYVSILIWPLPGRLSLEHDFEISASLIQPITTLISLAFLIVLTTIVIRYRRKYPLLTYGLLWFLLNLVIESSIVPLELVFEHRLYMPSMGFVFSLVFIMNSSLRAVFRHASADDFMKLSWCAFAILASVLSLLTFQRNEAWRDPITLNRDNVAKAPNHPRALGNLASALSRWGAPQEAITQGYKAIALGQENFESYCEAANTIVISYSQLGDHQSAAGEGERFIAERPANSGASHLPVLCLSTAAAYRELGDLASAYRLVMQALFYNQHLESRMAIVSNLMTNTLLDLLERASSTWIDLDGDAQADPGLVSSQVWVARRFIRIGENREGRSLLLQALQKAPGDTAAQQLLQKLEDDEGRNREQGRRWSFRQVYVMHPFSRHNFLMACAYLPQAWHLPAPFRRIGEICLDHALRLNPASADAHLLKGWYSYHRDRVPEALIQIHQAIELDPTYAKSWLALGFFQIKAGSPQSAIDALRRTLELYPGCPDRVTIKDLMSQLYLGMYEYSERSTPQGTP